MLYIIFSKASNQADINQFQSHARNFLPGLRLFDPFLHLFNSYQTIIVRINLNNNSCIISGREGTTLLILSISFFSCFLGSSPFLYRKPRLLLSEEYSQIDKLYPQWWYKNNPFIKWKLIKKLKSLDTLV